LKLLLGMSNQDSNGQSDEFSYEEFMADENSTPSERGFWRMAGEMYRVWANAHKKTIVPLDPDFDSFKDEELNDFYQRLYAEWDKLRPEVINDQASIEKLIAVRFSYEINEILKYFDAINPVRGYALRKAIDTTMKWLVDHKIVKGEDISPYTLLKLCSEIVLFTDNSEASIKLFGLIILTSSFAEIPIGVIDETYSLLMAELHRTPFLIVQNDRKALVEKIRELLYTRCKMEYLPSGLEKKEKVIRFKDLVGDDTVYYHNKHLVDRLEEFANEFKVKEVTLQDTWGLFLSVRSHAPISFPRSHGYIIFKALLSHPTFSGINPDFIVVCKMRFIKELDGEGFPDTHYIRRLVEQFGDMLIQANQNIIKLEA
jgi:hypothetical protein